MDDTGFVAANGMNRQLIPLSYTTPADGYFSIVMRPSVGSVLSATRYLFMTSVLDVITPPIA